MEDCQYLNLMWESPHGVKEIWILFEVAGVSLWRYVGFLLEHKYHKKLYEHKFTTSPFQKKTKYSFDFSIYVFFFDKRLQTHRSIFDKLILGGRKIILDETTPLQILSITQINSKVRYFILESFHKLVYFLSGKFHPIYKITTFQTYMHPSKSPKKHKPS